MTGVPTQLSVLGPDIWSPEDHVRSSLQDPLLCLMSLGTNINPYNPLPPYILKAHSVKCISRVPELDLKLYTEFRPWNEIEISPPIEATCQKLRTDGPDLGRSLLFTTTAWQHHESVMRTPLSWWDQAQSPGIAMKYSIVFTHCNLIPQKATKKQGFKCVCSWDFPPPSGTLAWAAHPRSREMGQEWKKGQHNQNTSKQALVKPDCWHFMNLMAKRTCTKNNLHSLIIYVRSLNILIMLFC